MDSVLLYSTLALLAMQISSFYLMLLVAAWWSRHRKRIRVEKYTSKRITNINYSEEKTTQKVINAVRDGDIRSLRKAFSKKGFDLNTSYRFEVGSEKMTALHYACREGMIRVMRELIVIGCDVNKETPFDAMSPLHFACLYNCSDLSSTLSSAMAQELLMNGADVNRRNHSGLTPLIIASEKGSLDLLRVLIAHGAELNNRACQEDYPVALRWSLDNLAHSEKESDEMQDPFSGNTALTLACREHHVPIVTELIRAGCDLNISSTIYNTSLHIACKSESRSNYNNKSTRTPIAGHLGIVNLLINDGCELDIQNKHLETPIHRAVDGIFEIGQWSVSEEQQSIEIEKFLQIVLVLIQNGACVWQKDEDCRTLLTHFLRTYKKLHRDWVNVGRTYELICKLIALSGCPATVQDVQYANEFLPKGSQVPGILEWRLSSPFSLKEQCRVCLRAAIRKPLRKQLVGLEIPTSLKRYITFDVLH